MGSFLLFTLQPYSYPLACKASVEDDGARPRIVLYSSSTGSTTSLHQPRRSDELARCNTHESLRGATSRSECCELKCIVWAWLFPLTLVSLDLSLHPRSECCELKLSIKSLLRWNLGLLNPILTTLNWRFGWVTQTLLKINRWLLYLVWYCYCSVVACFAHGELGVVSYSWDLLIMSYVDAAKLNFELC
jgi:hypothetical protein